MKILIVATHPIQHFCPQYASLSARDDVELLVAFDSLKGVEQYQDAGFGQSISWGPQLLNGYKHVLLKHRNLGSVADEFSPDLLIVYGYSSKVSRQAWAYALRRKTRLAYIADSEFRHASSGGFKKLAKRGFLSVLFKRVNVFLTVGNANEEYYAAHGVPPQKMVRMHFPIDPRMKEDVVDRRSARRRLGVSGSDLVLLNVGKFEPRKRQMDMIRAFANISGIRVIFAGSGQLLKDAQLAAKGAENIEFKGFVSPADLAPLYAAADVYVHPSEYDPHPLAVSEALSFGCVPVVSSATGSWGGSDDVIPGVVGDIFSVGDVTALRQAIADLNSDREFLQLMASRAKENSECYQKLAHGDFLDELAR